MNNQLLFLSRLGYKVLIPRLQLRSGLNLMYACTCNSGNIGLECFNLFLKILLYFFLENIILVA